MVDSSVLTVAIIGLIVAASAVACYVIANRRGGNAVLWGVMGALFGPLAIPFAFMSKRRDRE
jgi:hypothetical protein